MAGAIAADVNALIAPHIPYGITGSLVRNVIVLNGHGGGQTAVIESALRETALARNIHTLTVNWWSFASDITQQVFGEDGGHAGVNETVYIQAINPKLVHKEWYSSDMATPYPAAGTWTAVPFPSSIGLYKSGQGYPKDFDQGKAEEYFRKVNAKVAGLVRETIRKWQMIQ